jgi:TPR repeat protein
MSNCSNSGNLEKGIIAFHNESYFDAYSLLIPLAKDGCAKAQCYIASMYQNGFGVPISGLEAVKWYHKAAIQGNMEEHISAIAYNNLGTIYMTGMSEIPSNSKLAERYWSKAKELGFNMDLCSSTKLS